MRTFITWSGSLSHEVALELKKLLRLVFPEVDAFVSSEDIRKGDQWPAALTDALAESQRGIVCLTLDNFRQPWVLFEAGVLAGALQRPVLYTVLIDDLEASVLQGSPLSQFQHTRLECGDLRRLMKQINKEIAGGRRDADVDTLFDRLWPETERAISRIIQASSRKVIRIAELAADSGIIAGKVFRNAVIQGPAVLAILEGNTFASCGFESMSVDNMWWAPLSQNAAIGAIGLSRCRFENCRFRSIGLTGASDVLAALRGVRPGGDDAA